MPRPPRPELDNARRALAALIDAELKRSQRDDQNTPQAEWVPWTTLGFAKFASAKPTIALSATSVGEWRDIAAPTTPVNIIPLLKVLYGKESSYPEAWNTMLNAWRRASGYLEDAPPLPRAIEHNSFTGSLKIVSLRVFQPTPDNYGRLPIPFLLHINPDPNCWHGGRQVEIGITGATFMVNSVQWHPVRESVFSTKKHQNVKSNGEAYAFDIVGMLNKDGRIIDAPLEDVPEVIMETFADDPARTLSSGFAPPKPVSM